MAAAETSAGNDEVDDLFSRFMSEVTSSFIPLVNDIISLTFLNFINLIQYRFKTDIDSQSVSQ